jgi:hypothetical protein
VLRQGIKTLVSQENAEQINSQHCPNCEITRVEGQQASGYFSFDTPRASRKILDLENEGYAYVIPGQTVL